MAEEEKAETARLVSVYLVTQCNNVIGRSNVKCQLGGIRILALY